MDTCEDQLGGLGTNNALFLLKGVNRGKGIMMIWILYLSVLGVNF